MRMKEIKRNTLLKSGIIGSVAAAACCFTPILVWFFAAVGLAAFAAYLDYVLVPALVVFISITVYAFYIKSRPGSSNP